jgi:cytochrome c-type biogenesis protein CcmH
VNPRLVHWLALALVVVAALVVAETAERPALTNADRVQRLAEDFACPVCAGQSVAESDVPVARTIRAELARMVDAGATDDEVRTSLVARFGEDIDYTPRGSGIAGLVWVLPVVVGVVAVAALAVAVGRWQGDRRAGTGRWSRPVVLTGVVVVAVLAGVLVAQLSGSRGGGDTATGDIRSSTRTLLIEAGTAPPAEAVALYTEVLAIAPSNVEALAYRGWASWRLGDADAARPDLDAAVALDPGYPDVRVFRASQRNADGDLAGAAEDLTALDGLEAAPIVGDLLAASRLRERVAAGLASQGDLLAALELVDSGLAADPAAVSLLAERGWMLALTRETQLVALGVEALDEALAVDPDHPYALGYRALVRYGLLADEDGARADAAAFAQVPDAPPGLTELLVADGLLVDASG